MTTTYHDRFGQMFRRALALGGEPLLDRVESALGVALRHVGRIDRGVFTLTPGIEREIEASFARAEECLGTHIVRSVNAAVQAIQERGE